MTSSGGVIVTVKKCEIKVPRLLDAGLLLFVDLNKMIDSSLLQAKKIPAAARGVSEADMKYPKFILPQYGASGKARGAVSFRGISNRPNL